MARFAAPSEVVVSRFRASWSCALLLLLAPPVHATPVPGLFDTGVDDTGALLPFGAVDPHYALVSSADPLYPGPNSLVADPIPFGFWFPNSSTSQWIAPAQNQAFPGPGTPHPAGLYTYRLTFDLAGIDPSTVVVTGNWGCDNAGSAIRINGTEVSFVAPGYNPLQPFSITAGFVTGINQLDFVVSNAAAGGSNPTGLRVQGIIGTGTATVGVGDALAPSGIELSRPFPNPSGGLARLGFTLPRAARVRVVVLDLAGRTVRVLSDQDFPAGRAELSWDGLRDDGSVVGAGVYFVELQSGVGRASRRIVRMP
jgi:hypothetical protein